MLLLKACCTPASITFLSSIWVRAPTQVAKSFTQQTHGGSNCFRRSLKTSANVGSMRRQTAKERAAKLPKEFEQVEGRNIAVAITAASVLGYLAYFGPRLAYSPVWPPHVKQRICSTFAYYGASIMVVFLNAVTAHRRSLKLTGVIDPLAAATILYVTRAVARRLPYDTEFGWKHLSWLVHYTTMGMVVGSMYMLCRPIWVRMAVTSFGATAGFCSVAARAPNEKFMYIVATVATVPGVILASSLARIFQWRAIFVCSGFWPSLYMWLAAGCTTLALLRGARKVIKHAEALPANGEFSLPGFVKLKR